MLEGKPPFSHGFPMVFLWSSYGFPICFLEKTFSCRLDTAQKTAFGKEVPGCGLEMKSQSGELMADLTKKNDPIITITLWKPLLTSDYI